MRKTVAAENLSPLSMALPSREKGKELYAIDSILAPPPRDPYEMERAELDAYLQSTEYFPTKTSLLEFARRYNVPVNARTQREEIVRLCLRMIHDIPASFAGLRAAERPPASPSTGGGPARQALTDFFVGSKVESRTDERGSKKLSTDLLDTILRCHEVGLLLAQARGADIEMFRQILETCESPIQTHVRFLSNLVDFARLEAEQYEFARTPFRLRDCIGEALKRLAFSAHAKQLELCYDVKSDVPERVVGDPTRLQEVILHLVDNALKFTEQGEVVLEVKKAEQSSQSPVTAPTNFQVQDSDSFLLHFSVRDTGVGMPLEQLQSITQLFFSQGMDAPPRLRGLGLTIAHCLVKSMGGALAMSSEAANGSICSFSVRLHNERARGSGGAIHTSALGDRQILVVDDNAAYRRILHDLLLSWGARPHLAASGREALAMLYKQPEAEPFAAIVLDGHLADMEGFASIRRQHLAENSLLASPMLMMLASTDPRKEIERRRELQVAAFLHKPISPAELLHALLEASVSGTVLPEEEVLDRTALWALVAGDTTLLQELIGVFEQDCGRFFFALQHAVLIENYRDVMTAVHALQGTASHFAARGVLRISAVIESFSCQGDFARVQEAMTQLAAELSRLKRALDDLQRELSSSSTSKDF